MTEDLDRPHSDRDRSIDRVRVGVADTGVRVPQDRIELIEKQRDQCRYHANAEQRDHERQ
jgi:hypothetical protein